MISNKHQINSKNKIAKILANINNADLIADKLSKRGALIPICPIGGNVYTYHPYIGRVIRYQVTGVHFTEDECSYDVECYENKELAAYGSLPETDFGVSCYLSRSAATKNTNVITLEDAKHISSQTKLYFKGILKFEYSEKTHQGFFKDIKTGKRISLRSGLKKLMDVDASKETQSIIEKYKRG